MLLIGHGSQIALDAVQFSINAFIESAEAVNHDYILCTHVYQQTADSTAGSTAAVDNEFSGSNVFFNKAQCAQYSRQAGNSGTMLVIMEYRNIADFFQLIFDFIAFGRGNILQVNACIVRLQQLNGADKFVRVFSIEANRHSVNITEGFEQCSLAFHYRHSSLRADVTQTKYTGTVGNNSNHVATAGIFKGEVFVLLDILTGFSYTRGIGNSQIMTGCNRHLAYYSNFAVIVHM